MIDTLLSDYWSIYRSFGICRWISISTNTAMGVLITTHVIMGDQRSRLHENFRSHGKLKNDCIRIKINIFEEMRFKFLIPYLILGFKVFWALVLLILSKFSFLSICYSFSRTFIPLFWLECASTFFEVHTNFICNPTQIIDREWLYIKFRKNM